MPPVAMPPIGHTVSVIGAAGFIGRPLLAALAAAGLPAHGFTRDRQFHVDGRLHRSVLESEVIYYVAGSITPATAQRDPQRVAADLLAFGQLLIGLQEVEHRPLVVLASSAGSVYHPHARLPYRENSITGPSSAYGMAKLRQERELLASRWWIAPVVLRLANVYGPGQPARAGYGVIGHWVQAVRAGQRPRMIGHPSSRRDYLHVADAVSAMLGIVPQLRALRAEPIVLNIGSGVPTSLDELHQLLQLTVGFSIDIEREPARDFDRADVWLDIRAAHRVLGWQPSIDLGAGLADVWSHPLADRRLGNSTDDVA